MVLVEPDCLADELRWEMDCADGRKYRSEVDFLTLGRFTGLVGWAVGRSCPAQQHLWPNWQHQHGYDRVAFAALVVLNLGQLYPDNPVPVIADMRSTAAFPLAM